MPPRVFAKKKALPTHANQARCTLAHKKLRYQSLKAAEQALARIILKGHQGKVPCRAYRCDVEGGCGGFHLTAADRYREY
jgi:hypothetical protein